MMDPPGVVPPLGGDVPAGSSVPARCASSAGLAISAAAGPMRPVPDNEEPEGQDAYEENHQSKGMEVDACDSGAHERRTGDHDAPRAWCEETDPAGNRYDPASGESNGATAVTDQK